MGAAGKNIDVASGGRAVVSTGTLGGDFLATSARRAVFRGLSLSVCGKSFAIVVNSSNTNGSALVCSLSKVSEPASNRICFGNGGVAALDSSGLTIFEEGGYKFIFRRVCLLSGVDLVSGMLATKILYRGGGGGAIGHTRRLFSLIGVPRVAHGGFPSRISNNRTRHTNVIETIVGGPRMIFTSRPAKTLGSGGSATILSIFAGLRRRKRDVVVMARSGGATLENGHILCIESNGVFNRYDLNAFAGRSERERALLGGFLARVK